MKITLRVMVVSGPKVIFDLMAATVPEILDQSDIQITFVGMKL
jgi:hypothetical protein